MALNVSPRIFRIGVSLWPPYLGAGIRCTHMSKDWREARVTLKFSWYNRNFVGTHFGGSLYSMTDAFYAVMLFNVLEQQYWVWDQKGSIEYLKPGKSRVSTEFKIDDAFLERVKAATANGDKYLEDLSTDIIDEAGEVIARVTRTIYVRKKKQ